MGYYTTYTLTASDQEALNHIVNKRLEDEEDESFIKFLEKYDNAFSGNCKGYEHESELAEASREFPEVLFTLEGHGEERGDSWIKYFKNGQVNDSILTFSDFNPEKMRDPRG